MFEDNPETDTHNFEAIGLAPTTLVWLYPMFAPNRREEREDIILDLQHMHDFRIEEVIDFTEFEDRDVFLEGTGSIVLDRVNERLTPHIVHELIELLLSSSVSYGLKNWFLSLCNL